MLDKWEVYKKTTGLFGMGGFEEDIKKVKSLWENKVPIPEGMNDINSYILGIMRTNKKKIQGKDVESIKKFVKKEHEKLNKKKEKKKFYKPLVIPEETFDNVFKSLDYMIKSGYHIAISCNKCDKGLYYINDSWFLKPGELPTATALEWFNGSRSALLVALKDELTCPKCGNTSKSSQFPRGFSPWLVRTIDNIDYAIF
ncbi:MAG: hypothetical protein ACFFDH_12095 [Promethearchaeota archaeon]